MAKTLMNVWLTLFGPGMAVLFALGVIYGTLQYFPYYTFWDFVALMLMVMVATVSGYGLFKRIWGWD